MTRDEIAHAVGGVPGTHAGWRAVIRWWKPMPVLLALMLSTIAVSAAEPPIEPALPHCFFLWHDVYPLGEEVMPGEGRAHQEIRQEMCVTATTAALILQRRIYREDASGQQVEVAPWSNQSFGSVRIPWDYERWDWSPPSRAFHIKPTLLAPQSLDENRR